MKFGVFYLWACVSSVLVGIGVTYPPVLGGAAWFAFCAIRALNEGPQK